MRRGREFRPVRGVARLFVAEEDRRPAFWTRALGEPAAVYGERLAYPPEGTLRRWDPHRSKLGAALAREYDGQLPADGERWLYLGAATGTTASHVADLVGPNGAVFAVEKSLRPFARLLRVAERYPNLFPVLADARRPESYAGTVTAVDGLYLDLPQVDQVAIALANARSFLRADGPILVALKTASMGRDRSAREHLTAAEEAFEAVGRVESAIPLEPFHRRHYFLEVRLEPERMGAAEPVTRGPVGRRARRRS